MTDAPSRLLLLDNMLCCDAACCSKVSRPLSWTVLFSNDAEDSRAGQSNNCKQHSAIYNVNTSRCFYSQGGNSLPHWGLQSLQASA